MIRKAIEEELERIGVDCNLVAAGAQPRRIYFSEEEIYYLDNEVQFLDEVSGKVLKEEGLAA